MEKKAVFFVADIPVYGELILSPMAGYSDPPYRALCRHFGSAMNYTEFIAAEFLQGKPNKMWRLLDFKVDERPKIFQIFGNDAQKILRAAQNIEQLEPDIIDINMGCSTKKVSGRGAGVGMMLKPELIAETFRLLSTHLSVPVTGKIRLGWDQQQNYLEVGRILEDNGARLVAIHGRTKEQKYTGEANWDAIAELKHHLSIPVIGNGDIVHPADIERMKAYTNCDGIMIGRGAIGNPWIFSRRAREDITLSELLETIRYHFDEMVSYHGLPHGLTGFRKHLKRYIAPLPDFPIWSKRFMLANSVEQFYEQLDQYSVWLREVVIE